MVHSQIFKGKNIILVLCFLFTDNPNIPVLKQVIEQACQKASLVTRSPQQDAKRYEVFHREKKYCLNMYNQNGIICGL